MLKEKWKGGEKKKTCLEGDKKKMKNKNKIRALLMAIVIVMSMAMVMPAAMSAPDTVTLNPNAAGDYQEWTLVGSSPSHWEATSDATDDTYIEASAEDQRDVQNLENPPFGDSDTVNSITIYCRAYASGSKGPERIAMMARLGTTDRVTGNIAVTRNTWAEYNSGALTTAPDGQAWTKQKVTDLQAGIKVNTLGTDETIRVSKIWIVVDYSATPDTTPPGKVTNVTVIPVSSSQLNVSWTANTEEDLDHYNVYRSETSGFAPNASNMVASPTTNFYLDTGLKASTTYYYRVTAVDTSANEGNASDEAWGTTEAELPPTPNLLTGWVFYENGTECNGPVVNVKNLNSGNEWQAETYDTSNYYELILDSYDKSVNDVLRFTATDGDATQKNVTDYTITQAELDDGGIFWFNHTLHTLDDTMHVASIEMWYKKTGQKYKIYTKVKIVDFSDAPVAGVTVYLNTTLPGGTNVSSSDVTVDDGTVQFRYGPTTTTGIYRSTVTDVTKDGWTYDPAANVATSETLTVP